MTDLIDRKKMLEIYKNWIPQLYSKEDEGDRRGVETCIAVLEDAPAVDAVEVVRCKDCRNGKRGSDNIVKCNHPSGKIIMMTAYGFCSYGGRKEDG